MKRIETLPYPVPIGSGLIEQAGTALGPVLGRGRVFLVTDENVARTGWAEKFRAGLGRGLLGIHRLRPGEENKDLKQLEELLHALIEAGVERTDVIAALGGGTVGDLAGFAAAILKRGCGYIQIPTTLLAQADSAVGGKTGINLPQGKNLIGAFHRPVAVLIDPGTLGTLPARELRAGYAEVVKYGLIGHPAFFAWCEAHGAALLAGDDEALGHAIETSVRAKAAIVARDERETAGHRLLLNFGHSFAHALEAEAGFSSRLLHGEAVATGMVLAFRLSVERGLCPAEDSERVSDHLEAVGLPVRLEKAKAARLVAHMANDKKRSDGRARLILTRGIGEAFVDDSVTLAEIEDFLERQPGS